MSQNVKEVVVSVCVLCQSFNLCNLLLISHNADLKILQDVIKEAKSGIIFFMSFQSSTDILHDVFLFFQMSFSFHSSLGATT